MWQPDYVTFCVSALFSLLLSTANALRCYSCNSNEHHTCVDLSERCTFNIDCRADFIAQCSDVQNSCAVTYGPNNQVWRGCYSEPRIKTISNDQDCSRTTSDGTRVCLCQVDMCNTSSRFHQIPSISVLCVLIVSSLLWRQV
ncbi:hypothetical protein RvY_15129 [Ramazzottius varieornatus]|uniref:Protein sleepless n=1 Tax=Ramazzottius varieornatus TaxID=947166 RepID=A0A1D1W203_RAMVA|nr:hypothetical protein RvY_15129 [Ramazzottius varieornatus]